MRKYPKDIEKYAKKLKEIIRLGELEELQKTVNTWIFLERHLYHFITNIVSDDAKTIEELEEILCEKFGKRINWIRVKRAIDYLVHHKYVEKTFGHRGAELKTVYLTKKEYPIVPPEELVKPASQILSSVPYPAPEPKSLHTVIDKPKPPVLEPSLGITPPSIPSTGLAPTESKSQI